ncbi:calcium/calmodulin-dependent protein kinase type 1G-like [Planoprotostelium fungivorum]|uniref:non-specific serine/threonine protein kinase n=1 Tax=Planoprotostelium fungivorum TaxID=1890364 RepID=A0A2P6NS15_9EUKA|nr:calcium/calmodulin-dependent protein kinase type 1G-like [Planoprotostelium fungivorum]
MSMRETLKRTQSGRRSSQRLSSALFTPVMKNNLLTVLDQKLQETIIDEKTLAIDLDRELPLVEDADVDAIYTFKDQLGEGATSVVFLAVDKRTNEEVAIKIMQSDKLKLNRSLLREIKVMRELNHVNIIGVGHLIQTLKLILSQLKNVMRTQKELFVVMELAEGEPLFEHLCDKKTYSEQDAKTLVKEVLVALAYMHAKGIAHRDIKPENVLCHETSNGVYTVKLVDFGFATSEAEGMATPLGTLGYKAPELVKKEVHSMTVDCWSLGVMTYIFCQDHRDDTDFLFNTPFWYFFNKETPDLENAILSGQHDFPEEFWKNISDEAKSFVDALLQIDVSKRMDAKTALLHPWIVGKSPTEPLRMSNSNASVVDLLRATSYATLARKTVDLQGLLTSETNNEEVSWRRSQLLRRPTKKTTPIERHKAIRGDLDIEKIEKEVVEAEQSTQGPKINDPIIRTGYAEIKVLNTFTKRWFILHEGVLCYYRTEKDDPREYFGVIHLLDTKVYLINKDQIQITHTKKQQIFYGLSAESKGSLPANILHHRDSSAILRVPQAETLMWIADIQKAIDSAKNSTLFSDTIEPKLLRASSPGAKMSISPRRESSSKNKFEREEEKEKRKSIMVTAGLRRSFSSYNTDILKREYMEIWTNGTWKLSKMYLSPDRLVTVRKPHKGIEKNNRNVDIPLSDILSIKTEFATDPSWMAKGWKFGEGETMWGFMVTEKKVAHYFRSHDRMALSRWVLLLENRTAAHVHHKGPMDADDKAASLGYLYCDGMKGGMITSSKNDDIWIFNPKERSVTLSGNKKWHLAWNGRQLIPSINAPINFGTGLWDGETLEWKESSDRNSRVLEKYRWYRDAEEHYFAPLGSEGSSAYYWRDNTFYQDKRIMWQVLGDVPPALVLCLQLATDTKT